MRQLNVENHFSHPRPRVGGPPILFSASDSANGLPARRNPRGCSRQRGNSTHLLAASIEGPKTQTLVSAGIFGTKRLQ